MVRVTGKGGGNRPKKDVKNASLVSDLFMWMLFIVIEKNKIG